MAFSAGLLDVFSVFLEFLLSVFGDIVINILNWSTSDYMMCFPEDRGSSWSSASSEFCIKKTFQREE